MLLRGLAGVLVCMAYGCVGSTAPLASQRASNAHGELGTGERCPDPCDRRLCEDVDPTAGAKPGGVEDAATAEIGRALDDWHDAAARSDEERYFSHFAASAVFLGTDATERWDLPAFRAYAHPHFARGKAWSFHALRRAIVVSDRTAWFDEDLATENLGAARGSGVLVRDGGAWKIVQYNLAITVPNERFDDVKRLLSSGGVLHEGTD